MYRWIFDLVHGSIVGWVAIILACEYIYASKEGMRTHDGVYKKGMVCCFHLYILLAHNIYTCMRQRQLQRVKCIHLYICIIPVDHVLKLIMLDIAPF